MNSLCDVTIYCYKTTSISYTTTSCCTTIHCYKTTCISYITAPCYTTIHCYTIIPCHTTIPCHTIIHSYNNFSLNTILSDSAAKSRQDTIHIKYKWLEITGRIFLRLKTIYIQSKTNNTHLPILMQSLPFPHGRH